MNEEQQLSQYLSVGYGQTRYKRQLAYKHLGIDPEKVECLPFFGIQLRRIARVIRGVDKNSPPSPRVEPLKLLESSKDPEARKVIDVYESVPPSYRRLLPLEAYCLAANVSPWHVLEMITIVGVRQGLQFAALLAAGLQLRVVDKTIDRALTDEGTRERMLILKAVGFAR